MPQITPQFILGLEDNIRVLHESSYLGLLADSWTGDVVKLATSKSQKEIFTWHIATSRLHDMGTQGGNLQFDDRETAQHELEHKFWGEGLQLKRSELEDLDGKGIDQAAAWSEEVAVLGAYHVQDQAADILKNGHTASKYSVYTGAGAFFQTNHYLHPNRPGGTKFANLFTGAASGSYPGALPVHAFGTGAVSSDTALINLGRAFGYIAGLKAPNGVTPGKIRPKKILAPPSMMPRLIEVLSAKFLAAAAGAGGSSDVQAVQAFLGYGIPQMVDELSDFEDEQTYFIVCEMKTRTELGPMLYSEREAFHINWYGPQTQALLDRTDEFEWHYKGRNRIVTGHARLIFKVKGS